MESFVSVGLDVEREMTVYSSPFSDFRCWLSCSGPRLEFILNSFLLHHRSNSSIYTLPSELTQNVSSSLKH